MGGAKVSIAIAVIGPALGMVCSLRVPAASAAVFRICRSRPATWALNASTCSR
jgi:hypothetical protein